MSALRLVLFDLDGTLADTAADIASAANRMLADAGRPLLSEDAVRSLVSSGARAIVRAGFASAPEDGEMERLVSRLFDYYAEQPAARTRPFPGLGEVIAEVGAGGLAWAVVTNKPERIATPIVSALGLRPDALFVIGGDSLPRRKPDPLPLLAACARAGVAPSEALYVGDAQIDVEAARAAGMEVAVAGFGYAPSRPEVAAWGPHLYLASVAELGRELSRRLSAGAS